MKAEGNFNGVLGRPSPNAWLPAPASAACSDARCRRALRNQRETSGMRLMPEPGPSRPWCACMLALLPRLYGQPSKVAVALGCASAGRDGPGGRVAVGADQVIQAGRGRPEADGIGAADAAPHRCPHRTLPSAGR
jgi:hypothetical protein